MLYFRYITIAINGWVVVVLVVTLVIVGALTFVPALALGPIIEHLQMQSPSGG